MLSIVHFLVPICFLGHVVRSSEQAASRSNITACLLPRDEGNCRGMLPQYYYDRYTQTCEEFLYGGCDGNANNFDTLEDCEKTCWKIKKVPKPCRMEVETGPCRSYLRRYAYNMVTMRCEQFIYGGCYGNGNHFKDEASCLEACSPKRNGTDICHLSKDAGPCEIEVLRYYYKSAENRCLLFLYGGCKGNANNFHSKFTCERTCLRTKDIKPKVKFGSEISTTPETGAAATCQLRMEVGLCEIDVLRYYYNTTENRCHIFNYHGCFGNANNFMTKLDCEKTCLIPEKSDLSDYNVDSELSFAVEE